VESGADTAVPIDSPPVVCDGGFVCNGACVATLMDPNNCGSCGNVCGTGTSCQTSLSADFTTMPPGWVLHGTAGYDSTMGSVYLTDPGGVGDNGTFVYANPIVTDQFTVTFDFRIGYGGGSRADGMGFMFQKTGADAMGGSGGALGMAGLDGYGLELDVYDNSACGDTNGDHIGVDSLMGCSGLPNTLYESQDLTGTVDVGDANWHTATVTLQGGAMSASIDGAYGLPAPVALTGFVPGTPYFFGFAGATGGFPDGDGGFVGGYRTEVRNVSFVFPTPRCL
jgi:hypothetical protein